MPEYIGTGEIILLSITRFWPTWLAIAVTLGVCWPLRERLGVFGRLYGSWIGMAGLIFVLFWVFTAAFADQIAVVGPLEQSFSPGMKKGLPGVTDTQSGIVFIWGGDNLARDIFSRVVHGSRIVTSGRPLLRISKPHSDRNSSTEVLRPTRWKSRVEAPSNSRA